MVLLVVTPHAPTEASMVPSKTTTGVPAVACRLAITAVLGLALATSTIHALAWLMSLRGESPLWWVDPFVEIYWRDSWDWRTTLALTVTVSAVILRAALTRKLAWNSLSRPVLVAALAWSILVFPVVVGLEPRSAPVFYRHESDYLRAAQWVEEHTDSSSSEGDVIPLPPRLGGLTVDDEVRVDRAGVVFATDKSLLGRTAGIWYTDSDIEAPATGEGCRFIRLSQHFWYCG